MLSSKLKLDPATVREDIESYLIDEDLIVIDGERSITNKGLNVLTSIIAQETVIAAEETKPPQVQIAPIVSEIDNIATE